MATKTNWKIRKIEKIVRKMWQLATKLMKEKLKKKEKQISKGYIKRSTQNTKKKSIKSELKKAIYAGGLKRLMNSEKPFGKTFLRPESDVL